MPGFDVGYLLFNPHSAGGGGGGKFNTLPDFFFVAISQKRQHTAPPFLFSCSDKFLAHLMKILTLGHLRAGHKVRSSDPTSKKTFAIVSRLQCWKDLKLAGFDIPPNT